MFQGFATILGIRPAAFGFERVEIAPLLGPLQSVSGSLVHPRGMIDVQLETQDGGLRGTIILPSRLAGTLRFGGTTRELAPGRQEVDMV